jgi:hypothetical protein
MCSVGDDANLAARVADGVDAAIGEGHREQRCGLAFTRGEEHVHFATRLVLGDRVGECDQVVGCLSHRRDDHDDVVASALGERDVFGDRANAIRIGNRRAAIFLNDQCHENQMLLEAWRQSSLGLSISIMSSSAKSFGGTARGDEVGSTKRGACGR